MFIQGMIYLNKGWGICSKVDVYKSIWTNGIALYLNANNRRSSCDAMYFDTFGVEHIPNEFKKFVGNKNVLTNIYRIQAYDLIICVYFRIRFIDFILNRKSLLDYTSLFSPDYYEKNDKITLKHF